VLRHFVLFTRALEHPRTGGTGRSVGHVAPAGAALRVGILRALNSMATIYRARDRLASEQLLLALELIRLRDEQSAAAEGGEPGAVLAANLTGIASASAEATSRKAGILYGRLAALVLGGSTTTAAVLHRGARAVADGLDTAAGQPSKPKGKEKLRSEPATNDPALTDAASVRKAWRHPVEGWGQWADATPLSQAVTGAADVAVELAARGAATVAHHIDAFCVFGTPFVEHCPAAVLAARDDEGVASRLLDKADGKSKATVLPPGAAGVAKKPSVKAGAKAAGPPPAYPDISSGEAAPSGAISLLPDLYVLPAHFIPAPAVAADAIASALSEFSPAALSDALASARAAAAAIVTQLTAALPASAPRRGAESEVALASHGALPPLAALMVQGGAYLLALSACCAPVLRVVGNAARATEGR
jgi:hypothetical protein